MPMEISGASAGVAFIERAALRTRVWPYADRLFFVYEWTAL